MALEDPVVADETELPEPAQPSHSSVLGQPGQGGELWRDQHAVLGEGAQDLPIPVGQRSVRSRLHVIQRRQRASFRPLGWRNGLAVAANCGLFERQRERVARRIMHQPGRRAETIADRFKLRL